MSEKRFGWYMEHGLHLPTSHDSYLIIDPDLAKTGSRLVRGRSRDYFRRIAETRKPAEIFLTQRDMETAVGYALEHTGNQAAAAFLESERGPDFRVTDTGFMVIDRRKDGMRLRIDEGETYAGEIWVPRGSGYVARCNEWFGLPETGYVTPDFCEFLFERFGARRKEDISDPEGLARSSGIRYWKGLGDANIRDEGVIVRYFGSCGSGEPPCIVTALYTKPMMTNIEFAARFGLKHWERGPDTL